MHVVASIGAEIDMGEVYTGIAQEFIPHSELGYNAAKDTQYLKSTSKGPPHTCFTVYCLYYAIKNKIKQKQEEGLD